jgi:hypothetical protein
MKDLIVSIIMFIGFIVVMSMGLSGLGDTQDNVLKIVTQLQGPNGQGVK